MSFSLTKDNKEAIEQLVALASNNDQDETIFRKLFSSLDFICNEYVLVTRSGKSSLYGYFAVKGKKKQHKFGREYDEKALQNKMIEAGLLYGFDLFTSAGDYIAFVERNLTKLCSSNTIDEETIQEPPINGGGSPEDGELYEVPPSDQVETSRSEQLKIPDSQKATREQREEDEENDGKEGSPGGTGGKKPEQTRTKKARFTKYEAVPLGPGEKKSCLFHSVPEIPRLILARPGNFGFTEEELIQLKAACNGTALYGVMNSNHSLYGIPLVCSKHSRRNYFHIYGQTKCPEEYNPLKLPNFTQVRIQGSGSRPSLQAGKVQSNAESIRKSRAKQAKVQGDLIKSYGEVLEEKEQLVQLVEAQRNMLATLEGQRDTYGRHAFEVEKEKAACLAELEQCRAQYGALQAQYNQMVEAARSVAASMEEKNVTIQNLQVQVTELQRSLEQAQKDNEMRFFQGQF